MKKRLLFTAFVLLILMLTGCVARLSYVRITPEETDANRKVFFDNVKKVAEKYDCEISDGEDGESLQIRMKGNDSVSEEDMIAFTILNDRFDQLRSNANYYEKGLEVYDCGITTFSHTDDLKFVLTSAEKDIMSSFLTDVVGVSVTPDEIESRLNNTNSAYWFSSKKCEDFKHEDYLFPFIPFDVTISSGSTTEGKYYRIIYAFSLYPDGLNVTRNSKR